MAPPGPPPRPTSVPSRSDHRQHLEIETPEHVILDYELAGIGSRALAAVLDMLLVGAVSLAGLLGLSALIGGFGEWLIPIVILAYFTLMWGYFTFFEGLRGGQTPGKRQAGIRVLRDTGHPITLSDAAARNLLRAADILPPPYLLGAILVAVHPRAKRLGDMVAGTVVVRDRPSESPASEPKPGPPPAAAVSGVPELSEEEFRLLREYQRRAPSLPLPVSERLTARLVERFALRFPIASQSGAPFLEQLYRDELSRRTSPFAARTSAGRTGTGLAVGDRFVARQSPRWDQFTALATRASTRGLDSFSAAELPDFAARYREVAADLARARVYQADPATIARLERLAAAGHNTFYRTERRTWHGMVTFLATECPAAVVAARGYVLVAFLAFAIPAVGGFLALRERPALAVEVLPDVILERAEAGRLRREAGLGYFEAPARSRPLVASNIITNNLTVAFNSFAGGIFLGVGSLVFLAYNGLSIGAASGHFANVGMLGYLWSFVVGHGLLELFAIWVAGGAGLMLGRAIVAPGDLTRAEALVISGRAAIRMIGFVIVLLGIAGLIEGFVSASGVPVPVRAAVSVGSAVFLVLYLWRGAAQGGRTVRR